MTAARGTGVKPQPVGSGFRGRPAKRSIARMAFVLVTSGIAVMFAIAVNVSPVAAVGATVLITVVALVASAMVVSPLRGALLLLGLCLVLVDGNFRVNITGQLDIDYQVIGKLSLYAVSLIYAVIIVRGVGLDVLNGLALLYTLALTLTALYAVEPLIAIGGAFILWSQALLALATGSRTTTTEELEQVWRTVLYSLVVKIAASWILFLVNPSAAIFNDDPSWQRANEFAFPRFGGYLGPNGIGFSAALLGALSLASWLSAERRRDQVLAALVCVLSTVSVVCSQSRTGLAALLVGALVVTAFQHRRLFYVTVLVSSVLAGYLFLYHGDTVLGYATRGRSLESLSSLEGRTEIWSALDRKILEEPVLGYGYGSARMIVAQLRIGGSYLELHAAHNMFYESMLNGGAAVTLLLIIMIVRAVFLSLRLLRRQPAGSERYVLRVRAVTALAIVFTNGMSESGICGIQTSQALLFFLVIATITADHRSSENASNVSEPLGLPIETIAVR